MKNKVAKFFAGLFMLQLGCLNAHAGSTIYKCQTATGLVMQDSPCANAAQTQSAQTYYAPRPCGSDCRAQNGNAYAGAGSVRDDQSQQMDQQGGSQMPQTREVSGYQCSGNGKTWVSATPCPASTTAIRPVMGISGFDQYGNHVTGSGATIEQVPVDQQALSHDELCTQLKNNPATSDKKATSGESAYERNKQRQLNGC